MNIDPKLPKRIKIGDLVDVGLAPPFRVTNVEAYEHTQTVSRLGYEPEEIGTGEYVLTIRGRRA